MKSIVEEASSVVKAIEKGWVQAGKPQEFSIKVFEVEQKNFLGMTTKSAKIAIFYNEKATPKPEKFERKESFRKEPRQPKPARQSQRPSYDKAVEKPADETRGTNYAEKKEKASSPAREAWTPELSNTVQSWLQETLRFMNLGHASFNLETKNYYLKISFNNPLFDDGERERLLFRSFAHLIMQSLRNKYKKGFRGYKIILQSPR